MKFGTKSILVRDGKVLLIRRSDYDGYRSGKWDIPGGRVEEGEKYSEGHKREVFEETKLAIEIIAEINHWEVERFDGFHKGVTFLSKAMPGDVVLSNEHTEHKWVTPEEANSMNIADWIKSEIGKAVSKNLSLFAKHL